MSGCCQIGGPFVWCSVAGYLSRRCRLHGSSEGLTCVWMGEFVLRRGDAESYFSAHSGGGFDIKLKALSLFSAGVVQVS